MVRNFIEARAVVPRIVIGEFETRGLQDSRLKTLGKGDRKRGPFVFLAFDGDRSLVSIDNGLDDG